MRPRNGLKPDYQPTLYGQAVVSLAYFHITEVTPLLALRWHVSLLLPSYLCNLALCKTFFLKGHPARVCASYIPRGTIPEFLKEGLPTYATSTAFSSWNATI